MIPEDSFTCMDKCRRKGYENTEHTKQMQRDSMTSQFVQLKIFVKKANETTRYFKREEYQILPSSRE